MEKFQGDKYSFSPIRPLILIGDDVIEKRNEQINQLNKELIEYKVLIRDLIGYKLSYEVRNSLLNIAMYIIGNIDVYEKFVSLKDLPIDMFYKEVAKTKKYIEEYKEYIIAYVIIFGNPYYTEIQNYVQIVETDNIDKENDFNKIIEENSLRGMVLAKNKKSAIIINCIGEFKRVSLLEQCLKGEEIKGENSKSIKDYKSHIGIVIALILGVVLFFTYKYNKVISTIVIETTSPIRIEVNGFDRVLSIASPTEKGNVLISETKVLDRDTDTALYNIIKYANENEMLLNSGVVLTVSGDAIKHDSLEKTTDYINEKDIKVRVNNSGDEHKIN